MTAYPSRKHTAWRAPQRHHGQQPGAGTDIQRGDARHAGRPPECDRPPDRPVVRRIPLAPQSSSLAGATTFDGFLCHMMLLSDRLSWAP